MIEWLGSFLNPVCGKKKQKKALHGLQYTFAKIATQWRLEMWICANMTAVSKLWWQMQNERKSGEWDSEFSMYSLKREKAAENWCRPTEIYLAVSSSFHTCPTFTPCYTLFLSSSASLLSALDCFPINPTYSATVKSQFLYFLKNA